MKNPNGYGTIRKLSGNRRKPWAVLAPQSSSEYSLDKQRKLIGCYATRAEAMTALGAWHKTPHIDVPASAENITLAQLCAEYKKLQKFKNLSKFIVINRTVRLHWCYYCNTRACKNVV